MKINELLNGMAESAAEIEISGMTLDSRKVNAGDAFFALSGARQHGLAYAAEAVSAGAIVVIYDPDGCDEQNLPNDNVARIAVPRLDRYLGEIAARFYGHPSAHVAVIGVTGTNGKTTCTQLIAQALENCGVIGTLGWGSPQHMEATVNTTPDAPTIQKILKEFEIQGKTAVAMEVSSHGLQQGRVNAVQFKGAVFTNLSRDHLDYHADMNAYLQAKLGLFTNPALKFAVVNIDAPCATSVLDRLADSVRVWTFSAKGQEVEGSESVFAENIRYSVEGIYFDVCWGKQRSAAYTSLLGAFNLENVLAVLAVLLAMDVPFHSAISRLAQLQPVVGRMEKLGGQDRPTVLVDYAHSPDALEKLLKAAKSAGRLWVVFGCGGDRDKGKRAEMGRIAETLADEVIITEDNPRSEPSDRIMADILQGCASRKVTVIADRSTAISTTVQRANKQDCVVIAGKGHEDYQEVNGVRLPFSDQAIVKQALAAWRQPL
jgi:UDP-N-acetylmuramoyl-L-alanyl-D-glutamate--2,6-diaminopimelate ligase